MATRRKEVDPRLVPPTRNKSWQPGQKGQGGEGMSKGYGGSAGAGTGPAGPETGNGGEKPPKRRTRPSEAPSVSLPSPETIARVLR